MARRNIFLFRYFPTMKIDTKLNGDVDDMYCVHGHALNLCRTPIIECLRKILPSQSTHKTDQPVQIADFGTADGRASLSLINEMIDIIQTDLGKDQAIAIYYNDQPRNDFNLLSSVVEGEEKSSGLTISENVFPLFIPRTMYVQCLPNESLDLSISGVASHYLSVNVCQIKNGVFMGEGDDNEKRLMKEKGKADWRSFVISRGRELKPGGFLITLNASSDEEDDVTSQIDKGMHYLGSFITDMAREGIITQEEYLAINFNGHYLRKAEDFKEPFSSALPEVQGLGLELISMKSMKHHLDHTSFGIVDKDETEKLEYSRRIVASVRSWMAHVILGGLSTSRTEEEKMVILDGYFDRVKSYAYDHSHHRPYIIVTEVVIQKKNVAHGEI
ncbi:uncharacterized protein LOC132557122 [Ylistrum balloti]|uniref:uncharacterized protein LOC132557122 n=1 Tax=Ylistrum balloti TaxID=509963 RepID=UPI002905B69C|nr:uncharacterized protein LOC132557122 [Ylistrum balloti]